MRYAFAAVILASLCSATFGDELPRKDCTSEFRARWFADSDAALRNMPKQPCWLPTQTGPYVCYERGCVRANAYFGG